MAALTFFAKVENQLKMNSSQTVFAEFSLKIGQSVGTTEDADCITAERWDSPNECSGYNTKQAAAEASVILELLVMQRTPLLPFTQVHSGLEW